MQILNPQQKKSQIISKIIKQNEVIQEGRKLLWKKDYFTWVKDNWTSRGEPLDFEKHKYLVQIYKDQSPFLAMMKSAQTGATERMITEALWLPDQYNENSIYFFPTSGTISDLVQERIDEPINGSKYLAQVSGRAKKILGKHADKIGLKKMSRGFIYFRGSNKPTQITSIAGDVIFADEVDRMLVTSIPFFTKRFGHSNRKWERWASTPTFPNFGIHKIFLQTDQHHFFVKCTHCNEWQELDFLKNVEYKMKNSTECESAKMICVKCKQEIVPWLCESEWRAVNPSSNKRGYFLSKLYSPMINLKEMVESSQKTAEWEVQQFHNQDLGLPYEPKGARITDEILNACKRDYKCGHIEGNNYLGVDVGTRLHIIIQNDERVIAILSVKNFEDLYKLMDEYDVKMAVIDAMPETRKAQEFANKFDGRVFMCYYSGLKEVKDNEWFKVDGQKVNTDRTLSLDMWTARVKKQKVYLPKNLDDYTEFKEHMKALTRATTQDAKNNPKSEYVQLGPDHYYHAGNYSNLAKEIYDREDMPEVFGI